MNKMELIVLAIALNIAFFGLFYVVFLRDSEPEQITIYFNGTPLRVSVDGHGLESAGGHNYQTGIIYDMRRIGKDIIINTKYDPAPPQPAFSDSTKITFECDGEPCEMMGDTVVLFTLAEGDTVKTGTRLFFIGMKP